MQTGFFLFTLTSLTFLSLAASLHLNLLLHLVSPQSQAIQSDSCTFPTTQCASFSTLLKLALVSSSSSPPDVDVLDGQWWSG